MGAVLDVLYEDGPPSAPAVASDATAAGQALPCRDEPLEEATPIDLRPSRPAASTRGRHARPSASNDNDEH